MKTTNLACGIAIGILVSVAPVAGADPGRESALTDCRNEAMSTGLQEEPDIQAYISLCMQAWQTPDSYAPADASPETTPEATAESQGDNLENAAPPQ
jgi:hypothetical protein